MNHATKKLIEREIKNVIGNLTLARETREKQHVRAREVDRDIADMERELHDLKEALGED